VGDAPASLSWGLYLTVAVHGVPLAAEMPLGASAADPLVRLAYGRGDMTDVHALLCDVMLSSDSAARRGWNALARLHGLTDADGPSFALRRLYAFVERLNLPPLPAGHPFAGSLQIALRAVVMAAGDPSAALAAVYMLLHLERHAFCYRRTTVSVFARARRVQHWLKERKMGWFVNFRGWGGWGAGAMGVGWRRTSEESVGL
jgi:hypothetical protein